MTVSHTSHTASHTVAHDEICRVLLAVLNVEPGDVDIEPDMSLTDDLGLESIDLVTVNSMLTERFGDRVNLAAHLAELDIDDVISLRVRSLVEFLDSRLAA